jgi:hypothetical protein
MNQLFSDALSEKTRTRMQEPEPALSNLNKAKDGDFNPNA